MQKKLITMVFIFITSGSLVFNAQAQDYCENGSYGNQLMWIESISSGPIINDTGPFNNNYGDQDHLYIGYADYSDQILEWQAGLNPLALNPGRYSHPFMDDYPSYWQVWIDLNSDQAFSEGELVFSAGSLQVLNTDIDLSGLQINSELLTRMRISVSFYENMPPCGSIGHGEVEDYSVRIVPALTNTLRVPEEYSTIQTAVDAATSGDHIRVNDGDYEEDVIVNKPLTIESVNGYEYTSVSSSYSGISFLVQSPLVTIKGFELTTDYLQQYAGIYFFEGANDGQAIDNRCSTRPLGQNTYNVLIRKADRVTVKGLMCDKFSDAGIWAEETADSQFIDNIITNQIYHGIYLREGSGVLINNNTLNENRRSGLGIDLSNQITVTGNICSENVLEILPAPPLYLNNNHNGFGISAANSDAMVISGNQCNNNSHAGFNLKRTDDVQFTINAAKFNVNYGLLATQANNLKLDNNQIENNLMGGADLAYSDQVMIDANVFESNGHMGLRLQTISNSEIKNNWVNDHLQSAQMLNSNYNQWDNNVFATTSPNVDCNFELDQSSDNQMYLNQFIGVNAAGICSLNNSSNQWQTSEVLEYQYLGLQYGGQLGNYYSDGDHSDINADGVSELPYILPGNEPADNHALSNLSDNYIFQQ